MKKEQEKKLIQIMVDMMTQNDKNFVVNFSMKGNKIDGLDDNFNLILTDYTADKYKACALGVSTIVGEVENNEDFAVFGVRTNDNNFMLDLVDLKRDFVYDICVIDDFVGVFSQSRCVEIDEKETVTSRKLNYQFKKINFKEQKDINEDCIDRYENKVIAKHEYYFKSFRSYLLNLLYTEQYRNNITSQMAQALRSIEIKVYVNTIYNYFLSNPDLEIEDYSDNRDFARSFNRVKNKDISKFSKVFIKYPSELFNVYSCIKKEYKNNCVFAEYEDLTSLLM